MHKLIEKIKKLIRKDDSDMSEYVKKRNKAIAENLTSGNPDRIIRGLRYEFYKYPSSFLSGQYNQDIEKAIHILSRMYDNNQIAFVEEPLLYEAPWIAPHIKLDAKHFQYLATRLNEIASKIEENTKDKEHVGNALMELLKLHDYHHELNESYYCLWSLYYLVASLEINEEGAKEEKMNLEELGESEKTNRIL